MAKKRKKRAKKVIINKLIFVLAGSYSEYEKWYEEAYPYLNEKLFRAVYLPVRSLDYKGLKNCFYTTIGTYKEVKYHQILFDYFRINNIQKI